MFLLLDALHRTFVRVSTLVKCFCALSGLLFKRCTMLLPTKERLKFTFDKCEQVWLKRVKLVSLLCYTFINNTAAKGTRKVKSFYIEPYTLNVFSLSGSLLHAGTVHVTRLLRLLQLCSFFPGQCLFYKDRKQHHSWKRDAWYDAELLKTLCHFSQSVGEVSVSRDAPNSC